MSNVKKYLYHGSHARPKPRNSNILNSTRVVATTAAMLLAGVCSTAWAQERNFSAERFLLASDRDGMLGVDVGTVIGHLNWEAGFWAGLADDPLSLYESEDGDDFMHVDEFLTRRIGGSIVGAIGFKKRYQLGLQVPLIVNQRYTFNEPMYAPNSTAGLGDIRIVPKIQLLFSERHKVDVALIPAITIPTGTSDSYAGEDNVTFAPELAVSRWLGAARVAGNLGYRIRANNHTEGLEVTDELFVRLAAGYRLGSSDKPVEKRPIELDVSLSMATRASDFLGKFNTNHTELITGGSYQITPKWNVLAGAGMGLRAGHGTPDWRVLASLRYTHQRSPRAPRPLSCEEAPPTNDPDCDGIPTAPTAPLPGSPPLQAEDGLPPPTFPIAESVWEERYDYCPQVPGTKPYHGCPEPRVTVNECSGIDILPGIVFETSGDDITRPSKVPLEALVAVLKGRDQQPSQRVNIEITGVDKGLAEHRGELIKSFLTRKGANSDNIAVVSHQIDGAAGYQVAFTIVCPKIVVSECSPGRDSAPISVSPALAFENDTDGLTALSSIPLDQLASEMIENYLGDRVTIEVAGPDPALAEKRARKLLDYLQNKGVKEVFLADLGTTTAAGAAAGTTDYSVTFKRHCTQPKLPKKLCQKFDLNRKIQFDVNSDVIKPASTGLLKRDVAWILQDFPDVQLVIEGHTSSEGKREYNLDLSRRRAESVVNYLASKGIDSSRLKAIGYGPDQPLIAEEKTDTDREKNRRIEFRVTYAKDCPCDKIDVDKIQFHFNSPKIKQESFASLQDVARSLKSRPDVHLRIEGHTSSEGSQRANKKLSQQRAKAILTFLRNENINRRRLRAVGLGESKLLVKPDDTEEKREINRRVEFIITKGGKCEPSK